jgi:hypothetical protein
VCRWQAYTNVHFLGGYLGQMCNITRDILGKCAISRGMSWDSWANILYKLVRLLKKDDVVRLVDIYNSDKMFKSN